MTRARAWHLLTFLVAGFALVLQFVLIWRGDHVLDETSSPPLSTRVIRFASYLTIWSNALVAWSVATLVLDPLRDGRIWRALRLNAVVICFGGGVVHFFLLRPLLDLNGAPLLADRLLHMVVPLLAVVGWVLFGPRDRIPTLAAFLAVPLGWLAYTLIRGPIVDWYPYPFIDVIEHGYGVVLLNCVGVTAFMLGLYALARWLDPRLPGVDKEPSVDALGSGGGEVA
ncbi:Pr6Pr family membrane protein [Nocardioides speluncae]|uniref:Pr6Pr family membrane protein n=1 Tax=Nocardioides speluncae TaxID=2670337 RepID=UPI000D68CEE0|nr:Pr6Pr family membrane protein [Nocardioides speluncae]